MSEASSAGWKPARPTVYKGTLMRSRTEAGFAQWLDSYGFDWEYEPCAFGAGDGQYLPDFRINNLRVAWDDEPRTAYVEVKYEGFTDSHCTMQNIDDGGVGPWCHLLRQMPVIWESAPHALLMLAEPGRGTSIDVLWPCSMGPNGVPTTSRGLPDGHSAVEWFWEHQWQPRFDGIVLGYPGTVRSMWPEGWWKVP